MNTTSSLTPMADRTAHPHGGSADAVVTYAQTLIGKPVTVTVLDGLHRSDYGPVRVPGVITVAATVLAGGNAAHYVLVMRTVQPYRGGRSDFPPTTTLAVPVGRVLDIQER